MFKLLMYSICQIEQYMIIKVQYMIIKVQSVKLSKIWLFGCFSLFLMQGGEAPCLSLWTPETEKSLLHRYHLSHHLRCFSRGHGELSTLCLFCSFALFINVSVPRKYWFAFLCFPYQGFITYYGVKNGDLMKLVSGYDSYGNVCGRDNTNNSVNGSEKSGKDMTSKKWVKWNSYLSFFLFLFMTSTTELKYHTFYFPAV